ncbi:hypothetical protein P692DRAFT_20867423 [Suillus brevipes Sb2]|nr:hypothetical protein P692DRAFT_20867423 [Suillus brevipes Sb2]
MGAEILTGTLQSSCVHQNVLAKPLISSASSEPPFTLTSLKFLFTGAYYLTEFLSSPSAARMSWQISQCEDSPTSAPFLLADLETHTDISHLRIIAPWDLSAALCMLHPRPATAAHANSTLARTAAPTTISPKSTAWKPSASSCFKLSPFRQLTSASSYNGRAERRLLRPLE